jgi:glyoxalase family protein
MNSDAANKRIAGIHHVTAITADAQKNVDFYCGVLGLRLVKLTVNFDDPESYHLYYGDQLGRPGSIMTFFAWGGGHGGRIGAPQVTTTSFAAPAGAIDFWSERLRQNHIAAQPAAKRFGEQVIGFKDPDGMNLEIIGATHTPGGETQGPLPKEQAIFGFHSATISEEGYESTARLLMEVMGFQANGSEGNRFRYRTANGEVGSFVDLLCVPDARHGSLGTGIVHHIAFRTPNDEQQAAWRNEIVRLGFNVSPVIDRSYFHSIYFREPGGVLFEIATDNPGFATDEAPEKLGTTLKLPEQYESYRSQLEKILPRLRVPEWNSLATDKSLRSSR